MPQWTYHIVGLKLDKPETVSAMNVLGLEGWELVYVGPPTAVYEPPPALPSGERPRGIAGTTAMVSQCVFKKPVVVTTTTPNFPSAGDSLMPCVDPPAKAKK